MLCLIVIASGLALRHSGGSIGSPVAVVKYGGSILWGTMIFLLTGAIFTGQPRRKIAFLATAIALAVEVFRLYHTSWLDAFRLTTAGALLLGRVFSIFNIVAYTAGIILGLALDRACEGDTAKP